MGQLKKVLIQTKDVFKNPVVAFGAGATLVMLADTWFDVSTTDFVSAGANVAMAGIAYAALVKAKQIWDEKGKDVGHKYAMKLLTEVVPTLNVSSSSSYGIHLMNVYLACLTVDHNDKYCSFQQEIDNRRGYIKDVFSLADSIKVKSIDEMNILCDMCSDLISQINISGIAIKSNVAGGMLKKQVSSYSEFNKQLMDVCYEIRKALFFFTTPKIYDLNGEGYGSLDQFMRIIDLNNLNNAMNRLQDLEFKAAEIKDNLQKMKEGKYKVSDYFDFG